MNFKKGCEWWVQMIIKKINEKLDKQNNNQKKKNWDIETLIWEVQFMWIN